MKYVVVLILLQAWSAAAQFYSLPSSSRTVPEPADQVARRTGAQPLAIQDGLARAARTQQRQKAEDEAAEKRADLAKEQHDVLELLDAMDGGVRKPERKPEAKLAMSEERVREISAKIDALLKQPRPGRPDWADGLAGFGLGLLFLVLIVAVYFAPWICASNWNCPSRGAIALVNTLVGWTLIGWIGAWIMAITDRPKPFRDHGVKDS
jgi:hypothetical protein